MPECESIKPRKVRHEAAVAVFYYLLFKQQHNRRENEYYRQYAENNALCHDKADIESEPQLHKAQRQKAEHRRQRASHERRHGHRNGLGHGVLARVEMLLFLGIAVYKEYGIVHRNAELQNSCDALGYKRYLPEEDIRSHVVNNGKAERKQDDERLKPRLHENAHDDERQNDGDGDVKRCLSFGDLACIVNDDGQAAQELIFAQQRFYLRDGLELTVVRACVVVSHEHHRLTAVGTVENILQNIGQDIGRDADIGNGVDPDDRGHAVNLEYFVFQRQRLLRLHVFGYDYGYSGSVERFIQHLLALHGFEFVGKIREYIVVYLRSQKAQKRGDKQQKRRYYNRFGMLCLP